MGIILGWTTDVDTWKHRTEAPEAECAEAREPATGMMLCLKVAQTGGQPTGGSLCCWSHLFLLFQTHRASILHCLGRVLSLFEVSRDVHLSWTLPCLTCPWPV